MIRRIFRVLISILLVYSIELGRKRDRLGIKNLAFQSRTIMAQSTVLLLDVRMWILY